MVSFFDSGLDISMHSSNSPKLEKTPFKTPVGIEPIESITKII